MERSDAAKKKQAEMKKGRVPKSRKKNLMEYLKFLRNLREQVLPWYFSIERVGYTASMPKRAREIFENLGGRGQ